MYFSLCVCAEVSKSAKLLVLHWTQIISSAAAAAAANEAGSSRLAAPVQQCETANPGDDSLANPRVTPILISDDSDHEGPESTSTPNRTVCHDNNSASVSNGESVEVVEQVSVSISDNLTPSELDTRVKSQKQMQSNLIKSVGVKAKAKLKNRGKFSSNRRIKSHPNALPSQDNSCSETVIIRLKCPVLVASPAPRAFIQHVSTGLGTKAGATCPGTRGRGRKGTTIVVPHVAEVAESDPTSKPPIKITIKTTGLNKITVNTLQKSSSNSKFPSAEFVNDESDDDDDGSGASSDGKDFVESWKSGKKRAVGSKAPASFKSKSSSPSKKFKKTDSDEDFTVEQWKSGKKSSDSPTKSCSKDSSPGRLGSTSPILAQKKKKKVRAIIIESDEEDAGSGDSLPSLDSATQIGKPEYEAIDEGRKTHLKLLRAGKVAIKSEEASDGDTENSVVLKLKTAKFPATSVSKLVKDVKIKSDIEDVKIKSETEDVRIKSEIEDVKMKSEIEDVKIKSEIEDVKIKFETEAVKIKSETDSDIIMKSEKDKSTKVKVERDSDKKSSSSEKIKHSSGKKSTKDSDRDRSKGIEKHRDSSDRKRDKDSDRNSSKSSYKHSLREKERERERRREKERRERHSGSKDSHRDKDQLEKDKSTLEKVKPLSTDGMAKIPKRPSSFLDALGSADPGLSGESQLRKPPVKIKSSSFRSTGLLDPLSPKAPGIAGKRTILPVSGGSNHTINGPSVLKLNDKYGGVGPSTDTTGPKRPEVLDPAYKPGFKRPLEESTTAAATSLSGEKKFKTTTSSLPPSSDRPGGVKLISPKRREYSCRLYTQRYKYLYTLQTHCCEYLRTLYMNYYHAYLLFKPMRHAVL